MELCVCERGLDAFEFSIVCFSVVFFFDFWELCFARGDSMLLSFRLFAFLLLVLDFRNGVSVRGGLIFLNVRLFVFLLFFLTFGIVFL